MSGASMEGISAPTKWQLGGQHAGIVRGHLPKLLLSPVVGFPRFVPAVQPTPYEGDE